MTEEDLDYNDGEYNEAGEEQEYDGGGEEEGEGEWDGNEDDAFQVGDEIQLTHEEVWDDTALIEAWDAAVKQYEVYHSKSMKDMPKSNTTITKNANADISPSPASSSKRSRSESHEENAAVLSTTQPDTKAKEPEKKAGSSSSTEYTASDRKPSFKKSDKPAFSHYKEHKEQQQNDKKRVKLDAPKYPKKLPSTDAHPIDDATIAYYRQMGYYFDPKYAQSSKDSEPADPSVGTSDESTSKSKASTSEPTSAPAHYPHMFSPYGSHHTHNPYIHPSYQPYTLGYPHSIPHIPQGPGTPYPMGGVPGMAPFRSGVMPGFPPMPPPPPMPVIGTGAGPDDDTLSNLMMAWYFSGYYTGLYQAQRRQ